VFEKVIKRNPTAEMPLKKNSPAKTSAPAPVAEPAKKPNKMSPKAAVAKAATVEPTVDNTVVTQEKSFTSEEIEFFRLCLDEEAGQRISSPSHLQFYLTRGPVPPCDLPEGFVYRDGLANRLREIQRLRGIVSSAGKDPVDYKDHGVDKTISRKELRALESSLIAEVKRLPAMLEHGIEETNKREKRELKESRIEDKVQKGENLLVIRKEVLDAMKSSLGKSATLGETETKKTRTGIHQVRHYKFTDKNLDAVLAMFKRSLPTVRSNVVNLLMRYMSEKKIPLGVGKKGEASATFSMPKEFVTAFKKVVGSKKVEIDTEKMIFSDVQKLIGYITEDFTGTLTEKDRDDIMADIALVDFAKSASKEARERELKAQAAAAAQ
jgi:hypothetical protein